MTDWNIKPTALQGGMPKEHRNGFFGIEEQLLGLAIDQEITVVATFKLATKTSKEGADAIKYPEIAIVHLEPIWDDISADDALKILKEAHKERTGKDQLDIPEDKPASKKKAADA